MFAPRGGTPTGSGHTQTSDMTSRKRSTVTPPDLFSPRGRTYPAGRSAPAGPVPLEVRPFGSLLPVKVLEACTTAVDRISVKVEEGGWAWMVCGGRVIIWKIGLTAMAKMSPCKDLQLPNTEFDTQKKTEFDCTADCIAIVSHGPLKEATVQSVSVLVVVAKGVARFWPCLAHPGSYTDTAIDMGEICNFVVAVKVGSFIVCSSKGQLLRVSVDFSGRLQHRALRSGIMHCVSRLFFTPPVLQSVLWVGESRCLYTLKGSTLSKWEVGENSERQLFSWDAGQALTKRIAETLWGSMSAYEMKEKVNIMWLDVKLSWDGLLVVLAAVWHCSETPCLAYYCLVTLQDNGATISDRFSVEVTEHNPPFQGDEALRATRLMLPQTKSGPAAFLYNKELVFVCSAGTGRRGLKIPFSSPRDGVCGGGCYSIDNLHAHNALQWPVFFSKNNGFVTVLPRESASMLPGTTEESLRSSLADAQSSLAATPEAVPSFKASAMDTPRTKDLKEAFLQFCRNDVVGAQTLTNKLFPEEGEGELDSVVTHISQDLVDYYPASDPRWAESVPDQSASGFPQLTSLIILHQLQDKMKVHGCFMDFLLRVGLLDRLSEVTVRRAPMATRLLLCEHGEKLQAAMVLRYHHTKHAELLNRAILSALQKNNAVVPPGLTPADVFFREVSQISSVFECLLEEERSLKNEVVVTINNIIKDMLHAACQYRESKASIYRPGKNTGTEPEYIPWTASGGARGVRGIISRQHELILSSVYPLADTELRSVLCEQLFALLDIYFDGYVSQLASLPRSLKQRYGSLEMEYSQRRSELLTQLLKQRQYQMVAVLAEKYRDFDTLVQLCELTDDQSRLQHYMTKFADQNFSDFLFQRYMEKGQRLTLLSQPLAQHQQLSSFLQAHQDLSWLHHVHIQDFQSAQRTLYNQASAEKSFVKKKTFLALSKLSALASDVPVDAMQKQVNDILVQERVLLHQETLPKQLLEEKQMNPDVMPVLTAHNLIKLYVCDDNRKANEHDFKKALDLLEYIDEEDAVNIDALKCQIFGKALAKDDWSSAESNDDPLEAAKDSVFVNILLKLIQEGVPLQTYLPDVKDLLDLDELTFFKSKPSFEFVLRANYEHYIQVQSPTQAV